jgi:hypothetical protein
MLTFYQARQTCPILPFESPFTSVRGHGQTDQAREEKNHPGEETGRKKGACRQDGEARKKIARQIHDKVRNKVHGQDRAQAGPQVTSTAGAVAGAQQAAIAARTDAASPQAAQRL